MTAALLREMAEECDREATSFDGRVASLREEAERFDHEGWPGLAGSCRRGAETHATEAVGYRDRAAALRAGAEAIELVGDLWRYWAECRVEVPVNLWQRAEALVKEAADARP